MEKLVIIYAEFATLQEVLTCSDIRSVGPVFWYMV